MTVRLSPACSVVVRALAAARIPRDFGDVFDRDDDLVVFGPFFDTVGKISELERLGLVFTEDFFDLPHSGGTVPDWCAITLTLQRGGHTRSDR